MLANPSTRSPVPCETIASPEEVPDHELVPIRGPGGESLRAYRGVRRRDTGEIISVVSDRYALVGHREVARIVHRLAETLERPALPGSAAAFPRERIRLYAGGRRMEHRLVVGRLFRLGDGESFYPAVRVMNSLDGSIAVRVDGFAVRIACLNQLFAGRADGVVELRELHLASADGLLGQVRQAIHAFLANFGSALDLFSAAMGEDLAAAEVEPALVARGLPRSHAGPIGGRCEAEASHNARLRRWTAYQIATAYLTREVHVNPDRERFFERAAASALLKDGGADSPPELR